jgi:hypothetical protein
MSFSQMSGGARQGERLLSQSRGSWDRRSSAGYGSRGEAAARYRQPPAPFQPSEMRGRGGGAWPQIPSGRGSGAELDTGIGSRAERHSGQSSFDDLGVDTGGPDLGIAANEAWTRTPPRDSAPTPRPSSTNGRGKPDSRAVSREARFGRGQRVTHLEYGAGTVIASSVLGSEELVLVRFDSRPDKPKNLSLSIHRLEPA